MPNLTLWEATEVSLLHPDFARQLLAFWDDAEKTLGLRLFLRKFGGLRTPGIQSQLIAWRNEADAKDGVIGGGKDYYRVRPAGTSHHEYGAAVDLAILDAAYRTDANYKRLADLAVLHGLRAGYYFSTPKDEFHFEWKLPLTEVKRRWQKLVSERYKFWGILTVLVLCAVLIYRASRMTA